MDTKSQEKKTTKICPACKTEISAEATRCPHCQKDLRSWFRRHSILTAIIALFVIGLIASSSNGNKTSNSASQKSGENKAQQTEDPNPHFKDGIFEVGKDIQAGTYRTRIGSSGCYYSRLSGFGGSLGEIISNENTDYPAVITIAATDKGFKSSRCGTWTKI
ncbi:MAG: hypothetical protein NT162_00600 [Candidatus Woesebacteria bacterium]|nr:hypothetical protein [Candidatus Woesebacteria bacterium]